MKFNKIVFTPVNKTNGQLSLGCINFYNENNDKYTITTRNETNRSIQGDVTINDSVINFDAQLKYDTINGYPLNYLIGYTFTGSGFPYIVNQQPDSNCTITFDSPLDTRYVRKMEFVNYGQVPATYALMFELYLDDKNVYTSDPFDQGTGKPTTILQTAMLPFDNSFVVVKKDNRYYYLQAPHGPLVPIMTSDTTPEGVVRVSGSYDSSYSGYKAFTGEDKSASNPANSWASANNGTLAWIQYESVKPVLVNRVVASWNYGKTHAASGNGRYKLQGSDDGIVWKDIKTGLVLDKMDGMDVRFTNTRFFKFHRLQAEVNNLGNYSQIGMLQFYGY